MCDVELFQKIRKPAFVDGLRNPIETLDEHANFVEATKFIKQLWNSLKLLYDNDQIYESDIKDQVNQAIGFISEEYNHISTVVVKEEHWPAVVKVAKEMIEV